MTFRGPVSSLSLSVTAVLLVSAPAFAEDGAPQAHVEDSAAPASPLAGEPLDRLSTTRERPLFSPTRRPPPPPPVVRNAEPPPPPPLPPPNVALFGVVMDGDEVRAIVRTAAAANVMRVRVGDDIGGWRVAQIDGRRLVLVLDDRIATFTMFAGSSAKGAPGGGPQVPPAGQNTPPAGQNPQTQTPPQNQSPRNDPASPPHRRRGSLALQKYSMVK
jgi:general secretion pathway protein N